MDDDVLVRTLVVRALREVGYEVVAVRGGEAGLNAANSAGGPYDLVITNEQPQGLFPGLPILRIDDLSYPIRPNAQAGPALYRPFSVSALWEAVALALAERPKDPEA